MFLRLTVGRTFLGTLSTARRTKPTSVPNVANLQLGMRDVQLAQRHWKSFSISFREACPAVVKYRNPHGRIADVDWPQSQAELARGGHQEDGKLDRFSV
jgi:hypothetical protein